MNTKPCIACKEDILKDALKCKFCHQTQTKVANLQNTNTMNYAFAGLITLAVLWMIYSMYSLLTEEPAVAVFKIGSPELLLTEKDQDLIARCIAEIENITPNRWRDISLQAEFKNSSGYTIDILYSKLSISLYPKAEFSGMVSGLGSALKSDYDSCELSIINAIES